MQAIASGLHYAFGACAAGDEMPGQRELAASARRHRRDGSAARRARPSAGLSVAPFAGRVGGGFWLTAFTARTQLVEFVLREARLPARA